MPIGRAIAALVFGKGKSAVSIITTILASVAGESGDERVRFTGPVAFHEKTIAHVRNVILPIIDRITTHLGLPLSSHEISTVNIDAASINDVGVCISGYSADVPMFLAMLSATLEIPVMGDLASTGHIASLDGDIRMVKSIPEKLQAAADDRETEIFLHPSLDKDASLKNLSPKEREKAIAAICGHHDDIRPRSIANVAEAIEKAFSEPDIILASLKKGFFAVPTISKGRRIDAEIIEILTGNGEERFWSLLQYYLLKSGNTAVKALLSGRARCAVERNEYPRGVSKRLLFTLQAVPPAVRRLKIDFPLLPLEACIQLTRCAKEPDYEDVRHLFDAVEGKGVTERKHKETTDGTSTTPDTTATLDVILSSIDESALSKAIGIPIDNARAGYIMNSVTVNSREEFFEAIESFYLHLVQHTHALFGESNPQVEIADSHALLERAYRRRGGVNPAYADAKQGINSGMRGVLDAMVAQYKAERRDRYIQNLLNRALNPLDWQNKVKVMTLFIERLGPNLPEDIRECPPEQFVNDCGSLVRAYVESMERVRSLLR